MRKPAAFSLQGKSHEQLIVRSKEWLDNATPSGNSVAALVLLRIALLTANEDYRRRATTILRLMADQIRRYPSAFGFALSTLDFYLTSPLEIAVVGKADDPGWRELWSALWGSYLPNRVIVPCNGDFEVSAATIPLLRDRNTLSTRATAFVCQEFTCQSPVVSASELRKQLSP